jgi:hypothetical protein
VRDLERKIEKLEQQKNPDSSLRDELDKYFEEENVHFIDRLGILGNLGFIDGEQIAKLIRGGAKNN